MVQRECWSRGGEVNVWLLLQLVVYSCWGGGGNCVVWVCTASLGHPVV